MLKYVNLLVEEKENAAFFAVLLILYIGRK